MIDEATYDELDRYFHSSMNEQERGAFELKMNGDKELREEFDWINNMLGGMKSQGRSIMKQTIATAIAGVPSGEVVKYQPSLNRKSFLKKYWVAITIVIVTISVAVAIYAYMTRHTDVVHEGAEDSIELIPMKDSLVDSCSDAISSPPLGGSAVDTSDPQQKNALPDLLYENGNQAQPKAKSPKVAFDRDSAHPWGEENRITLANGESQVAMKTTIIQGPPPYKYELTDRLILKANYSTTAGFVFTRKGDTFYMTDNSKQRFMLLKGKGELPLVPMNLPQK